MTTLSREVPFRIGERLLVDEGPREVRVHDICGDRVCCQWEDKGILRRSWIGAERLHRAAQAAGA